jgi:ATP-dependent Lon protease
MRVGISNIIIPEINKKDLEEIPTPLRNKINFIPVSHIDEVLKEVLIKTPFKAGKSVKPK